MSIIQNGSCFTQFLSIEVNDDQMQNYSVPKNICKLFGIENMNLNDLVIKMNELQQSIQTYDDQIRQLKTEIDSINFERDELFARVKQKKYQLSVDQILIEELNEEIKEVNFKKHNFLYGEYEGQITLSMAQKKGFFLCQKDTFHALKFLAKEIKYDIKNQTRNEIESLMKKCANTIFNFQNIYEDQNSLRISIEEKLQKLKNEKNRKIVLIRDLQLENNQLMYELDHKRIKLKKERKIKAIPLEKNEEEINSCLIEEYNNIMMLIKECNLDISTTDIDINYIIRILCRKIIELATRISVKRKEKSKMLKQRKNFYQSSIYSFQSMITKIKSSNNEVIDCIIGQEKKKGCD